MSVIVAKRRKKGGYVMAADSIQVRGHTQSAPQNVTKLERVGDLDIGSAGWTEEHCLMVAYAQSHSPASAARRDVIEWLAGFRQWKHERSDSKEVKNSYLVGYRGEVFNLDGCYPIDAFDAIGAGSDFALAALHLGRSPKQAVELAVELSVWCAGPVIALRSRG